MSDVAKQLGEILARISATCERAGRRPDDVTLIAVSKTFPAEAITQAWQAGQRVFGESRQQEAAEKIPALPDDIVWHFIGRVQRNKVRKILSSFSWVHAVDSLRLATYMDEVASEMGVRANVFLQVNLAGEESKGGFSEAGLIESIDQLGKLKSVIPVGLMIIPPDEEEAEKARVWFSKLRGLRGKIEEDFGFKLPYLSMGMSGDFEVAIEEGATHVRVGSAIFGKRDGKIEGELG